MILKKRGFAFLSLPKQKTVRGIVIKKAPLGKYLEMLEILHDFPQDILSWHFEDMSVSEILDKIENLDHKAIKVFLDVLFKQAPKYLISALSSILDIGEERLLQDPEIGLVGIIEIIEAIIEVNSLGKIIRHAKSIKAVAKRRKAAPIICSDS